MVLNYTLYILQSPDNREEKIGERGGLFYLLRCSRLYGMDQLESIWIQFILLKLKTEN